MEISFNLPHVFTARSSARENEAVLGALSKTLNRIIRNTQFRFTNKPSLRRTSAAIWTFDLPNVFSPQSSPKDNAYALRALLDGLIEINRIYLRHHRDTLPLYDEWVHYNRTQLWESIPALYQRKYGDCKSLTAALIAEYLEQGISAIPVFRFKKRKSGTGTDYHILVYTENGFEDPSKKLGMGNDENAWFRR